MDVYKNITSTPFNIETSPWCHMNKIKYHKLEIEVYSFIIMDVEIEENEWVIYLIGMDEYEGQTYETLKIEITPSTVIKVDNLSNESCVVYIED